MQPKRSARHTKPFDSADEQRYESRAARWPTSPCRESVFYFYVATNSPGNKRWPPTTQRHRQKIPPPAESSAAHPPTTTTPQRPSPRSRSGKSFFPLGSHPIATHGSIPVRLAARSTTHTRPQRLLQ